MFKMFLLSLLFIVISGISFAKITFVMLPMSEEGVSKFETDSGFNSFYGNLVNSKKFNIVDRERLNTILSENKLELSGLAENKNNIMKIGELLSADKLITSKIYLKASNQVAIFFQIIDVKTSQVEISREISFLNYSAESDGRYCAAEIIAKYPLLGEVLGKAGDNIIINLGENDGIKIGERIFLARNDITYGDNKEILYQEEKRLGILRVTGSMGGRSKTSVESLENPDIVIQKGDIVSPEPIPARETQISKTPLLQDVKKGNLILDDDMKKKKYLSVTYNCGESYVDGKLSLCATNINSGHVYTFYPLPYNNLQNFIMEGDIEFKKINSTYNRFEVLFRSNGEYIQSLSYSLYWHSQGQYGIYLYYLGQLFNLLPLQGTPAINTGTGLNHFKIVAYGSKFDFYMNDQFLAGMEDERLEKGYVGFEADFGGFSTVNNIKIWDAVK